MSFKRKALVFALTTGMSLLASGAASAEVLFWSTQAKPVEEAQAVREKVLAGFSGEVDFQPSDNGPWVTRVEAEAQAGEGKIGLLGSLHGNLISLSDNLSDLSDVNVDGVNSTFLELGKLGTDEQNTSLGCRLHTSWLPTRKLCLSCRKELTSMLLAMTSSLNGQRIWQRKQVLLNLVFLPVLKA